MISDPESGALPLLEDFFASPVLARARVWKTGTSVDDDASVERAFAQTAGAQPYRALSDAYRHYVQRSAPNGNGTTS